VDALLHAYPSRAEQLSAQHVTWLRECEAEMASLDQQACMQTLYHRSKSYACGETKGKPENRVLLSACVSHVLTGRGLLVSVFCNCTQIHCLHCASVVTFAMVIMTVHCEHVSSI
jgi:hypothetical protein